MSNRLEVTKKFIGYINELQPGNKNVKMYEHFFAGLTDEAFSELMVKLRNEEMVLPYYAPNLASEDVDIDHVFKVADKIGVEVFHQLWLTDNVTGVKYLTPEKYMILHLPIRRQIQHVSKGKSVTENSKYTDSLTGQPAGASRSSRLSLPEIMNLDSLGLHHAIEEMISVRGGNEQKFRQAKHDSVTTGQFSLAEVNKIKSNVTSTETLKSYLLGMHLDSQGLT